MLQKLIFQISLAILGLWLAQRFVPGVKFGGPIEIFLFCGLILGLINFFIKPVLEKITFPLRLLTLNLFGILINAAILWFIDVLFPELEILGILPLFITTGIILVLNLLFSPLTKRS